MRNEMNARKVMFHHSTSLSVALIVAVARGIQVIMNDGMITATILHWGEEGLKGLSSHCSS